MASRAHAPVTDPLDADFDDPPADESYRRIAPVAAAKSDGPGIVAALFKRLDAAIEESSRVGAEVERKSLELYLSDRPPDLEPAPT